MVKTCNGCKALLESRRATWCTLHEEIEVTKRIAGIPVAFKPKYGMCNKPKTNSDYRFYLQAMERVS